MNQYAFSQVKKICVVNLVWARTMTVYILFFWPVTHKKTAGSRSAGRNYRSCSRTTQRMGIAQNQICNFLVPRWLFYYCTTATPEKGWQKNRKASSVLVFHKVQSLELSFLSFTSFRLASSSKNLTPPPPPSTNLTLWLPVWYQILYK